MSKAFDPSQHGGEDMDGFVQPPPDEYIICIEDAELKTSTTGNRYINLTIRVAFGEYEGGKIWDTCSLLDNALWRLGDCCKSVGQTSVFDIDSQSAIRKALKGKVGKVRTKWEEYEGQKKTKVAKWLLCTDEERDLARDGRQQRREPDDQPPRSAGGQRQAGGPSPRDDIPF